MKKNMPENLKPPIKKDSDSIHSFVNACLSAVPVAGSLLSELFKTVVPLAYDRRLKKWMETVSEQLNSLQYDVERLKKDEDFIAVLVATTKVAVQTYDEAKCEYLQNILLKAAEQEPTNAEEAITLARFVDELLTLDIKLLRLLAENETSLKSVKSYTELRQITFRENSNLSNNDFYFLIQDLASKGLIRVSKDIEDFDDIYSSDKLLLDSTDQSKTRVIVTEFGKKFYEITKSKKY
jgi:hypothetical protein